MLSRDGAINPYGTILSLRGLQIKTGSLLLTKDLSSLTVLKKPGPIDTSILHKGLLVIRSPFLAFENQNTCNEEFR